MDLPWFQNTKKYSKIIQISLIFKTVVCLLRWYRVNRVVLWTRVSLPFQWWFWIFQIIVCWKYIKQLHRNFLLVNTKKVGWECIHIRNLQFLFFSSRQILGLFYPFWQYLDQYLQCEVIMWSLHVSNDSNDLLSISLQLLVNFVLLIRSISMPFWLIHESHFVKRCQQYVDQNISF